MLDISHIDKEELKNVWNQILAIMESQEADKNALKELKTELGSIIGAENSKETSAIVKALLKKQKDAEFYDSESVDSASELWEEILENYGD